MIKAVVMILPTHPLLTHHTTTYADTSENVLSRL